MAEELVVVTEEKIPEALVASPRRQVGVDRKIAEAFALQVVHNGFSCIGEPRKVAARRRQKVDVADPYVHRGGNASVCS